ncbi:hypothetical protein G6F62_014398 [Rhizopus arrhizus]|nr:hypothetical protein G6F62_014398 [Rhizopus arrhizus]
MGKPRRVALAGDLQPAAHAHAFDLRDDGMRALGHGPQRGRQDVAVIALHACHIGPLGRKLADVRACGEVAALAAHDHAAQGVVGGKLREHILQFTPHAHRYRVQATGVRQRHPGQRPLAFQPHAASHVFRHVPCPFLLDGWRRVSGGQATRPTLRLTCGLPSPSLARFVSSSSRSYR